MQIVYTGQAEESFADLHSYIARDSPRAAELVVDRILQTVDLIGQFPRMGREGLVEGTREMPVPNTSHLVVYRVEPEAVVITEIVHMRRQRPTGRG